MYFANGNRKVTPDKLNQGFFLGANAPILARIIPNPSPEYHLDNDHRFEVIEQNLPFNSIDPTLSLNILKRKDVTPNSSSVAKSINSHTTSGTTNKGSKLEK